MLDSSLVSLRTTRPEPVEYGEVFTRPWVVELILDLAGYTSDRDLGSLVAVEPSCGSGAFLGPMVRRLSRSCREHGRPIGEVRGAIAAIDLIPKNVDASRRLVADTLVADGWAAADATALARRWVRPGDYLLDGPDFDGADSDGADFVLGNPPYIRLEDVPLDRMAAYRRICPTMLGRADIYVGFYETGLRSLRPGGVLGFVCADRWMRNQYGRGLRQLVTEGYGVEATITMHEVDAFDEQVSAYPAITVIRRGAQGSPVVVDARPSFGPADASQVVSWVRRKRPSAIVNDRFEAARLPNWFTGAESWPAGSPSQLALIEDLNERFAPLEDDATGTRVGIGVATGADQVFVTRDDGVVEPDRLLPLSMVRDTTSGALSWSGHHLVNPWEPDGRLVDLDRYPLLRSYYQRHRAALTRRHVAGKAPANWYRTIDKVDHSLTARAKLLFPDMKLTMHPVLDEGGHYPHHNLYYVVSTKWDLEVLGGLLLSQTAQAFIEAYAVRMRGGTLRFQAQYLRRIRVPNPDTITAPDRAALVTAFRQRDVRLATETARRVYGITG